MQGKMYALQAVLTPTALDIVFRNGLKVRLGRTTP